MNYSFLITDLVLSDNLIEGVDKIVHKVKWTYFGEDSNGNRSAINSESLLSVPTENIIEFDQLSESDVIDWVEREIGPDQISSYNQEIKSNIVKDFNNEYLSLSLPWNQ